ncbi:MAG: TetR/AcrR family transcriptional regulator [Mycobacteriaceae bacterium]
MVGERKSWAGVALSDRQAVRRTELLKAGIELLGAIGGSTLSVRGVCRRANLTERYFYESFTDRDQFVQEVYASVGAKAHQALVFAVENSVKTPQARTQAAVDAFVELMVDHPEMGRVLLLSPVVEPALSRTGFELIPTFVALLQSQLSGVDDDMERQLVALGLIGALTSLFMAYLDGTVQISRERFVEHIVALIVKANNPSQVILD